MYEATSSIRMTRIELLKHARQCVELQSSFESCIEIFPLKHVV